MHDIFPFPTHVSPPANLDRARCINLLQIIRPQVARSRPSNFICDCLRYERTGRMGQGTDQLAESLCSWIDQLLNGNSGSAGFAEEVSGEYRGIEWRDANAEKLQRTRVAWIDWMIEELES